MIYSPSNRFLLVQNIKVGGTSLKLELAKNLPMDSYVTYSGSGPIGTNLSIEDDRDIIDKLNHYKNFMEMSFSEPILTHISYTNIKNKFPNEDWEKVTSCVFVRNPYSTVLSHFFMTLQFEYLVHKFLTYPKKYQDVVVDNYFNSHHQMLSTKPIYTDENKNILVNHVFKYENGLESEINKILPLVGLPTIDSIKYSAKKFKPSDITYKDVFSERHLDIIQKEWAWEFEEFKYDR